MKIENMYLWGQYHTSTTKTLKTMYRMWIDMEKTKWLKIACEF